MISLKLFAQVENVAIVFGCKHVPLGKTIKMIHLPTSQLTTVRLSRQTFKVAAVGIQEALVEGSPWSIGQIFTCKWSCVALYTNWYCCKAIRMVGAKVSPTIYKLSSFPIRLISFLLTWQWTLSQAEWCRSVRYLCRRKSCPFKLTLIHRLAGKHKKLQRHRVSPHYCQPSSIIFLRSKVGVLPQLYALALSKLVRTPCMQLLICNNVIRAERLSRLLWFDTRCMTASVPRTKDCKRSSQIFAAPPDT